VKRTICILSAAAVCFFSPFAIGTALGQTDTSDTSTDSPINPNFGRAGIATGGMFGGGTYGNSVTSGRSWNRGGFMRYSPNQIGRYQGYNGQTAELFSRQTVSPYLNLVGARGTSAAVQYFGIVRPQIEQNYGEWANDFRMMQLEGEIRKNRQTNSELEGDLRRYGDWAQAFQRYQMEGEEAKRNLLGQGGDEGDLVGDWAETYPQRVRAGEEQAAQRGRRATRYRNEVDADRQLKDFYREVTGPSAPSASIPFPSLGLGGYRGTDLRSRFDSYSHYYPNADQIIGNGRDNTTGVPRSFNW
jgi:hypothetical protein